LGAVQLAHSGDGGRKSFLSEEMKEPDVKVQSLFLMLVICKCW
jgi:hypothetical protein